METMIKKFCKKYKLPENTLHELLSHMAEVRFSKGELIISEGERNSNFYLLTVSYTHLTLPTKLEV